VNKLGGSSLIVTAIFLVVVGAILRSGLIDWLIDIIGLLLIALGIILGIIGLIGVLRGSRKHEGTSVLRHLTIERSDLPVCP
jgi:hypothetical protein